MPEVKIRKFVTMTEEIFHEGGPPAATPHRRGAVLAVINNPYAGRYVEEIQAFMEDLKPLGVKMARKLVQALGGDAKAIEGYGKGAAIIPSSKKRGGLGVSLDVPLGHKDAAFVRSHFDGMEVRVHDAPRANEILVAVAVTSGGRPLPRVGGLKVSEIKGEDGLR